MGTKEALILASIAVVCVNNTASFATDQFSNKTIDCLFDAHVTTTIAENGSPKTESLKDSIAISFSQFNEGKKEALLIGNAGSSRVLYIRGNKKIMLVEFTNSGNGNMTSISDPISETSIAFHSRHNWINGKPVVSHYYNGWCLVRK